MQTSILFISGGEIIFILLIVVLLFGSNKLPEIARMLGKGVKQFKDAAEDIKKEMSEESKDIVDEIEDLKKGVDKIKNVTKYKIFE